MRQWKLHRLLPALLLLLCTSTSWASKRSDIAILLSKDLPVYQRTLKALRKSLDRRHAVSVFTLRGDALADRRMTNRLRSYPFDCMVTIGAKATHVGMKTRGSRHLICCMTLFTPSLHQSVDDKVHYVSYMPPGVLLAKHLKELTPKRKRVGVFWHDEALSTLVDEYKVAFEKAGLTFTVEKLKDARTIPKELKTLSRNIDTFLLLPEPLLLQKETLRHLLLHLLQNEKPVFTFSPGLVKAGALFSLSYPTNDVGRHVAAMVEDCVNGLKPKSEIANPKLSINERVANFLKIKIREPSLDHPKTAP